MSWYYYGTMSKNIIIVYSFCFWTWFLIFFLTESWSKQVEEIKHCFCNTSYYRKGVMLKSQNFKTQKINVNRVCTGDSRQCVSDPQFVVDVQYWCFTSIATLVTWIFGVRSKDQARGPEDTNSIDILNSSPHVVISLILE